MQQSCGDDIGSQSRAYLQYLSLTVSPTRPGSAFKDIFTTTEGGTIIFFWRVSTGPSKTPFTQDASLRRGFLSRWEAQRAPGVKGCMSTHGWWHLLETVPPDTPSTKSACLCFLPSLHTVPHPGNDLCDNFQSALGLLFEAGVNNKVAQHWRKVFLSPLLLPSHPCRN